MGAHILGAFIISAGLRAALKILGAVAQYVPAQDAVAYAAFAESSAWTAILVIGAAPSLYNTAFSGVLPGVAIIDRVREAAAIFPAPAGAVAAYRPEIKASARVLAIGRAGFFAVVGEPRVPA